MNEAPQIVKKKDRTEARTRRAFESILASAQLEMERLS